VSYTECLGRITDGAQGYAGLACRTNKYWRLSYEMRPTGWTFDETPAVEFDSACCGQRDCTDQLGEITVTAARMGRKAVKTEVVSHSYRTGAPLDRVTLAWSVPFTDLDLSRQSDASLLRPSTLQERLARFDLH
jgi:hypothetical protein